MAEETVRSRRRDAAAKEPGKEKTAAGDVIGADEGSLHALNKSFQSSIPLLDDFSQMLDSIINDMWGRDDKQALPIGSNIAVAWASGSEEDGGSEMVDALGLGYDSDDASDGEAPQQQKAELETSEAAMAAPVEAPDRAGKEPDSSEEAEAPTPAEHAHDGFGAFDERESEDTVQLNGSNEQARPTVEEPAAKEPAVVASGNVKETAAAVVEEASATAAARVDDTARNANGTAALFSKGDRLGSTASSQSEANSHVPTDSDIAAIILLLSSLLNQHLQTHPKGVSVMLVRCRSSLALCLSEYGISIGREHGELPWSCRWMSCTRRPHTVYGWTELTALERPKATDWSYAM